ncbi:BZ3500_MvSof-1268-A1-R1_Chr4-2g07071 [Microbotryum saponariae]|uniref:DNA-(apurinic or apyrimidinic site) lyase n=1 Tax=Microbotryum saponariae TaxID=289078 RepID=A0A2X0MY53_9BASI|nr:BZ3500_MvSof-1268-A1-R1_Chr4-2g07071 [Microbotryum saponariae]SDA06736.1 BZ3501_MvSof-1269-A2-R1_Chr4-2g06782 [Microbotryum saponariae]
MARTNSSPAPSGSLRSTRSTYNSRVTLYEPTSTPTSTTSSTSSLTPIKRRSTRSSPLKQEDQPYREGQEEVKPHLNRKIRKEPSPRKPTAFVVRLDKAHPEPKRWREAYEIIREQRQRIVAPVDTMGCEQGGRERDTALPSDKDNRLSILVSLMLSSQTKDPVTHQAVKNLREQLPNGLCLDSLFSATPEQIDAAICKVGFHNIKTANLKKLAIRLKEMHGGDVPSDLTQLLAINGVGPKMAILYLQAIGINAGIGVDVHVHRISNRLGWHKPATNTPEQTRLNLESWLPKEEHPKINLQVPISTAQIETFYELTRDPCFSIPYRMLVGFGQEICKPVGPRCDLCDVAKVPRLCPSKRSVVPPSPRKTPKKAEGEEEDLPPLPHLPKVEIEVDTRVEVKREVIDGVIGVIATTAGKETEVRAKPEPESPNKPLVW